MRDANGRSQHIRDLCHIIGVHRYKLAAAVDKHPATLWRTLKRGLTVGEYIDLLAALALLGRSEGR